MSDQWASKLITLAVVLAAAAGSPARASADGESKPEDNETVSLLEASTPEPETFRLAVGPLVALRTMTFEGDGTRVEHNPTPYVGGSLSASGILWHGEQLGAFLSADLEVGYGLARDASFEPSPGSSPTTELTVGSATVNLDRRLGDHLLAGLGAGVTATSVTIEPNPLYTGHRYVGAETSLRLRWLDVTDTLDFSIEGGIQPVFALDNSDDGHGEGTAFGAHAQAQIAWSLAPSSPNEALRRLRLLVRYRYQRFRGQFPAPDSQIGSQGAVSVDNQHFGGLMIEYAVGR